MKNVPPPLPTGRAPLQSLAHALAGMAGQVSPVPPATISIETARGHVLAADLVAVTAVPDGPRARQDGWAVEGLVVLGASPANPVPLPEAPMFLAAGEPLPPGTDTILPPEAVMLLPPFAEACGDAVPGAGLWREGEEIVPGAIIAPAGSIPSLHALAAARLAGLTHALVRRPRVAILRPAATDAAIDDPVLSWLVMQVEGAGGDVASCRPAPRETEALAGAMTDAAWHADLVLVVGATGRGPEDHAAPALAMAGDLAWHGLALRPGASAGFGAIGATPVLLVPGRLAPAMAVWLALGRAVLARLAGGGPSPLCETLPLIRKLVGTVGLTDLIFMARRDGHADPLGSEDIPLQALARADGFVLLPPESEGVAEGAGITVEALP